MADLLGLKYENDRVLSRRELVTWINFEGVEKKVYELDGQHLCNIYYFMKYVNPEFYDKDIKGLIASEIDLRFDGKILEYRPLRRFLGEISFLKSKGYLVEGYQKKVTYIVIDGKRIGRVAEK